MPVIAAYAMLRRYVAASYLRPAHATATPKIAAAVPIRSKFLR